MSEASNREICLSIVIMLLLLQFTPSFASAQTTADLTEGPYINTLTYYTMLPVDEVSALQYNQIDFVGNIADYSYYQTLAQSQNIDAVKTPTSRYGCFIINTNKYPFNITQFRRAIAFALDKNYIADHIWNGFATPQDSVVPATNPLSIEGRAGMNYYSGEVQKANQMLDDAGFAINATTGLRQAPDGSPFTVRIDDMVGSGLELQTCLMLNSTFAELAIASEYQAPTYYDYRLYFHGDYDIWFTRDTPPDYDLEWLAYDFWSGYADRPYWNLANFRNSTYDSYREDLLHSTDYEVVAQAATKMQEILLYECPYIVAYEEQVLSAYRTDSFTGFANQTLNGWWNWWTNYKVHLINGEDGLYGGSFRRSIFPGPDTLNLLVTSDEDARSILGELYDTLFVRGPDGESIPWLAESYTVETHQDSSSVPEGYTRFVFQIRSGFEWSDGYPLTADDIAFTLTMMHNFDSLPYHGWVANMTTAIASTPSSLVIEFDVESCWFLYSIPYIPIFPMHIMMNMTQDDILNWNPSVGDAKLVTSGPFVISQYEPSNHLTFVANEHYPFRNVPTTSTTSETSTTTSITSGNTTNGNPNFFDYLNGFAGILTSNAVLPFILVMAIELVLGAYIMKGRREHKMIEEDLPYEISDQDSENLA